MIQIRKKSGRLEPYVPQKIVNAIYKSADRIGYKFQEWEVSNILQSIEEGIAHDGKDIVPVIKMHHYVELALDKWTPDVAASYRSYRNYKVESNARMRKMFEDSQSVLYLGDRSNANTNSTLAATQLTLTRRSFEKYIFQDYYMSPELKEAHDTGYLYVHDLTERRFTMNCCLFRMADVLKGGFEMANQWYNEPKRLSSAGGVIGDVVLSSASQQYGGFTVSEIDKVLAPYAEKSYNKYVEENIAEAKTALELAGLSWDILDETVKEKLTAKYIKAYPGIKEALASLKGQGYIICIASNKISKEVYRGLKICGLEKYIDEVIGAELMKEAKPSPDCINQLKKKFKVKKVMMIGDTETDILTGKNASAFTCGVTWCVSTKEDFVKWNADEIVSDPKELIKLGEKYANRI